MHQRINRNHNKPGPKNHIYRVKSQVLSDRLTGVNRIHSADTLNMLPHCIELHFKGPQSHKERSGTIDANIGEQLTQPNDHATSNVTP